MKKWLGLMVILIVIALFEVVSLAGTAMVDLAISESMKNCVFTIAWENADQKAEIEILSPTGNTFGTLISQERTTISEGRAYINVGNAEQGTWKVTITGEKLGRVSVSAGELPGAMTIDRFEVQTAQDGYRAIWNVSDCPEDITVEIFADRDSDGYDGQRVAYLSAQPTGEATFQLPHMENGYYFYYIKVSIPQGLFSYAYTDTAILYENPNSPDKLANVQAGVLNGDVFLSWEGEQKEFKVMLFAPDTHELLLEETTRDHNLVLPMPKNYTEVLAGVASYEGGRLGRFDLFPVSGASLPDAQVVYPEANMTNETALFAQVSFTGPYTVSATLNGELLLDKSPEAGKYQIDLKEGDNTIIFIISDDKGNMRSFMKELYLDSTAPQLALARDIQNTQTGDPFIYLEGYTEAGVQLTVNGNPVELAGSYFSHKYELKTGKNEIVISAKDGAGNESRYSAVVRRALLTSKTINLIIIGAVALLILVVEIVVLIRGAKRRKHESV